MTCGRGSQVLSRPQLPVVRREHKDFNLGSRTGRFGSTRPLESGVEFVLGGREIEMEEGEAWYLDLNLRHRVANRGASTMLISGAGDSAATSGRRFKSCPATSKKPCNDRICLVGRRREKRD